MKDGFVFLSPKDCRVSYDDGSYDLFAAERNGGRARDVVLVSLLVCFAYTMKRRRIA
jgi:hypothetical protein